MKEIRLWALEASEAENLRAVSVDVVRDTDTEQMLEELLVASPYLLMDRLRLIGRQVPTQCGPLDLLGLDETGRLVVFELKRGTLTREAVAQAIDYASDLDSMDTEDLCSHLQSRSGQKGIDKIDDFQDWYNENYPNSGDALSEKPRIVLVGLGADERTVRMVNFLAKSAIDIQLLTFHAFMRNDQLFLAKQIETSVPVSKEIGVRTTGVTKEGNKAFLTAKAGELKVTELLDKVKRYFRERLPAYEWPGKMSYSFSLLEKTEKGTPTYRVYVSMYLHDGKPGELTLTFTQNAYQIAQETLSKFQVTHHNFAKMNEKYQQVEMSVTESNWEEISEAIEPVVPDIVENWKAKQAGDTEET